MNYEHSLKKIDQHGEILDESSVLVQKTMVSIKNKKRRTFLFSFFSVESL